MVTDILWMLSGALALWYLLAFVGAAPSRERSMVKAGAVAALAGLAMMYLAPLWLILALACSAAGDWALSKDGDRPFLLGMAAFFAAHLAYLGHFAGLGADLAHLSDRWPAALALMASSVAVLAWLWPVLGSFRVPVAAYVAAILAMGLFALALPLSGGSWLILGGALSFILSDAILAAEKFRLSGDNAFARPAAHLVWIFYWVAQILILYGSLGQ